jgi:hypothetical protein
MRVVAALGIGAGLGFLAGLLFQIDVKITRTYDVAGDELWGWRARRETVPWERRERYTQSVKGEAGG